MNKELFFVLLIVTLCISDVMPEPRPGPTGPTPAPYDGDLESVVECPVCLVIPRDLPIPSCPAGQCCHQASDDG